METKDRRGTLLVFKSYLLHIDQRVLVDFRLSRGCGLEFKRHFARIKANCGEAVDRAPILWASTVPADAIPHEEEGEGEIVA